MYRERVASVKVTTSVDRSSEVRWMYRGIGERVASVKVTTSVDRAGWGGIGVTQSMASPGNGGRPISITTHWQEEKMSNPPSPLEVLLVELAVGTRCVSKHGRRRGERHAAEGESQQQMDGHLLQRFLSNLLIRIHTTRHPFPSCPGIQDASSTWPGCWGELSRCYLALTLLQPA